MGKFSSVYSCSTADLWLKGQAGLTHHAPMLVSFIDIQCTDDMRTDIPVVRMESKARKSRHGSAMHAALLQCFRNAIARSLCLDSQVSCMTPASLGQRR